MAKTILWRFDSAVNGKATGTLLKVERSLHNTTRVRLQWRPEGLGLDKLWIEDVPEKAIVWIDSNILPGLNTNRICILTGNGAGSSPIGEHLKLVSGKVSLELALAKEMQEATMAAKGIEAARSTRTEEAAVDKHIAIQKKLEGAGKSQFWKRRSESENLM